MKLASMLVPALFIALASGQALAGAAEDALAGSLNEYRNIAERGQWRNPWATKADAGSTDKISADQLITRIVASHTRELLDRGGWENTYLSNSRYASGNPLLAIKIGDGTTLAGRTETLRPAPTILAISLH